MKWQYNDMKSRHLTIIVINEGKIMLPHSIKKTFSGALKIPAYLMGGKIFKGITVVFVILQCMCNK